MLPCGVGAGLGKAGCQGHCGQTAHCCRYQGRRRQVLPWNRQAIKKGMHAQGPRGQRGGRVTHSPLLLDPAPLKGSCCTMGPPAMPERLALLKLLAQLAGPVAMVASPGQNVLPAQCITCWERDRAVLRVQRGPFRCVRRRGLPDSALTLPSTSLAPPMTRQPLHTHSNKPIATCSSGYTTSCAALPLAALETAPTWRRG